MKEHLKTALLILLGLSALYLLWRTWVYDNSIFGPDAPEPGIYAPSRPDYAPAAAAPARCAVMRGGERRGAQYGGGTEEVYESFKVLLAEALSSAGKADVTDEAAWRAALGRDGVYFEFAGPLPVALLAAWLSAGTALDGDVEAIGLIFGGGGAALFFSGADGVFYRADTRAEMAQWPELPELRPCAFAFETGYASVLAPRQLLIEETAPRVTVTASAIPDIGKDSSVYAHFLEKLAFSPASTSSYMDGGTRVYVDVANGQTCEISADGTIRFSSPQTSDGAGALAADVLLAWETVSALEPAVGGAAFEVFRVTRAGGSTVVEMAWMAGGVPVHLEPALVEIESGVLRRIVLKLYRVAAGEGEAAALPLKQAIALIPGGGEARLDLRYSIEDGGRAVWAVRS